METLNKTDVLNRNEGSDTERSRGKIFKTMLEKKCCILVNRENGVKPVNDSRSKDVDFQS